MTRHRWLMLHGAGGGGGWEWAIWRRVLEARGERVQGPDLMPAKAGLKATGWSDYREQILKLDARPQVLAGASMGGLLALDLAPALQPKALVLVNPVPPAGVAKEPPNFEDPGDIKRWSRTPYSSTRAALPDGDPAAWHYAHRRWRDESGTVLRQIMEGVDLDPPDCPVLVMASEQDEDIPVSTAEAVANWAGGELRIVPGASHLGVLLGVGAAASARVAHQWTRQAICTRI